MGSLRFLLALIVVNSHLANGMSFLSDGRLAVQLFFLISGFYMHMVWGARYHELPIRSFYISRALRIFPIYWVVLIFTASLGLIFQWTPHKFAVLSYPLDLLGSFIVFLPQLLLFGSEVLGFVYRDGVGALGWGYADHFAKYLAGYPGIINYIFVPQAWSLSLELMFYLLVPFIVHKLRLVMFVFAASLVLRLIVYSMGNNYAPWTFHLFPLEIALFLAGIMSHKFGELFLKFLDESIANILALGLILVLYVEIFYFHALRVYYGEAAYWLVYFSAFLALPGLFARTCNWVLDRYIGELSYPIYIVHYAMIFTGWSLGIAAGTQTAFVLLATLICSAALKFGQDKIDARRVQWGAAA